MYFFYCFKILEKILVFLFYAKYLNNKLIFHLLLENGH